MCKNREAKTVRDGRHMRSKASCSTDEAYEKKGKKGIIVSNKRYRTVKTTLMNPYERVVHSINPDLLPRLRAKDAKRRSPIDRPKNDKNVNWANNVGAGKSPPQSNEMRRGRPIIP